MVLDNSMLEILFAILQTPISLSFVVLPLALSWINPPKSKASSKCMKKISSAWLSVPMVNTVQQDKWQEEEKQRELICLFGILNQSPCLPD